MRTRTNLLQHYVVNLLNQPKLAWAVTIPLSCLDFTAWLSVSLLMLIVLRVGPKASWNLLCVNFLVNGFFAFAQDHSVNAWINAVLNFWPGYLSAIALYYTRSWHIVIYTWVLFAGAMAALIGMFWPDFALIQLKDVLASAGQIKLGLPISVETLSTLVFKYQDVSLHLVLGILMFSSVFNASMALTMARSLQSQIFYPGGFQKEMLSLRGCRWLTIILVISAILVLKFQILFPLYLIPTVLFYHYAVGLSIAVSSLAKNRIQAVFALMILATVLMPYVFIPVCLGIGALDSFMNFRFLLAKRVKPTI